MSLFKKIWGGGKDDPPKSVSHDPERPERTAKTETLTSEPPAERRQRKRMNAKRGLSALIIDDSPTVIAALSKTLRSSGYVTHEASSAEEGLEKIVSIKPSLIFLDIVLPGMNGFAALRLIRRDPATQQIPVVMISGNEHATEQFYANRIGADDFMKKPFSRFEVFSRIEGLLDMNHVPRRRSTGGRAVAEAAATQAAAAAPAPAMPAAAPAATPAPVAPAAPQSAVTEPIPATMSALDARKELTAMGLQYFDQEQYAAAVRRGDRLAIALFERGGGIVSNPDQASPSVLALAQVKGMAALAAVRKQSGQ